MEMSRFPATFGTVVALSLLYIIGKSIYNLYFHPLRSFPGSLASRAGPFWYAYHTRAGRLHTQVKELHDKYGEVVRISPSELSFNTSQAWQDIYGNRSSKIDGYLKDPTTNRDNLGNGSMFTANNEDHRRLRRLHSYAFSEKALAGQADIIELYISKLIFKLQEKARCKETAVVDLTNWYSFTAFDLIGDLAFGESFRCLDLGLLHPWVRCVSEYVNRAFLNQALARIHPLFAMFLRKIVHRSQLKDAKKHMRYSTALARKRIDAKTDRPDFMSYILKQNDDRSITKTEIEAGASSLVVAGSQTTSIALTGATFYLLKYPSVLRNLIQEIRSSFQSEEDITTKSTASLSYLNAVIEESLRMVPPIPVALPRISPPDRVISICGHLIPANTAIGVSHLSTYLSEQNFRDPKSFVPERWLGDPRFINDDRKSLQPFSVGPRNCIGRLLAYAEMRLILTRIIWNFNMELQEDSQSWGEDRKAFTKSDTRSLNVRLVQVIR